MGLGLGLGFGLRVEDTFGVPMGAATFKLPLVCDGPLVRRPTSATWSVNDTSFLGVPKSRGYGRVRGLGGGWGGETGGVGGMAGREGRGAGHFKNGAPNIELPPCQEASARAELPPC